MGRVATVQIKNVPEDVHRVLRRRAAHAGQSLQEYLLVELTAAARTATLEEVFDEVGRQRGGRLPPSLAAEWLREERDRRR